MWCLWQFVLTVLTRIFLHSLCPWILLGPEFSIRRMCNFLSNRYRSHPQHWCRSLCVLFWPLMSSLWYKWLLYSMLTINLSFWRGMPHWMPSWVCPWFYSQFMLSVCLRRRWSSPIDRVCPNFCRSCGNFSCPRISDCKKHDKNDHRPNCVNIWATCSQLGYPSKSISRSGALHITRLLW